MAIYVTSDLHFNHKNICNLERYMLDRNLMQNITTVEEYNNMVVRRINEVVDEKDTLYILGDFAFGNFQAMKYWLSKLNGYKILILGNHDRFTAEEAVRNIGFDEAYEGPIYLPGSKGKIILSHYPLLECYNNPYIAFNLHGHLHGSVLDLDNYINIGFGVNHFKPVDLERIIKKSNGVGKSRREKFLSEWYAEHQIFRDKSRKDLVLDHRGKINLEETLKLRNSKEEDPSN